MIKGAMHQEDITTINIYVPNTVAPKHIKQKLKNSNTIVGDFNTPLNNG